MKIKYHKRFEKQFKKLPEKDRLIALKAIGLFADNPLDPRLDNHALKGRMSGLRAIAVKPDLRIIFEEQDGYMLVIFLDIGKYNQVYK